MTKSTSIRVGKWQVDAVSNRISTEESQVELEPRVMDLLMVFASRPGAVLSKPELMKALWEEIHVNEDALTRSIFKLRKALDDDARRPDYIETVSKRGYRLIADVSPIEVATFARPRRQKVFFVLGGAMLVALAAFVLIRRGIPPADLHAPSLTAQSGSLLSRADGFYSQYTRSNNEAALRLYETVLTNDPENAGAMAGLSNALAQNVIRYQGPNSDGEYGRRSLTEALQSGWLDTAEAKTNLARSIDLAHTATELDPVHTRAWRALGLAYSAMQDIAAAERAYERALVIDPEDWGTMINLSELSVLAGRLNASTAYLEQAWFSMERNFGADPVAIGPWQSSVGLAVAERHLDAAALDEGRLWLQRVLLRDPLNPDAMRGLAKIYEQLGDTAQATLLCADLATVSDQTC